jgi:hypothetical protein
MGLAGLALLLTPASFGHAAVATDQLRPAGALMMLVDAAVVLVALKLVVARREPAAIHPGRSGAPVIKEA